MARKVINRKALRDEADAVAARDKEAGKAPAEKKAPAKRKAKAKKDPESIRMKLFWGVFNQTMKRVALYEFSQKKQAELKAQELSASGKAQHFVQKVKEEVVEKVEK